MTCSSKSSKATTEALVSLKHRGKKMIALLTTLSLAWEPKIAEMPEAERLEQFALEEKLITLASEREAEKVPEVMKIIDQGADPSYYGEYNYTALMWTAVRGKTGTAKVLLEAGADTEALNAWGRSAAFIAAWENRVEIMRLLLKHGMNASGCAAHDHWGPIHKAAEMGNEEIVRLLLDYGPPACPNSVRQPCSRRGADRPPALGTPDGVRTASRARIRARKPSRATGLDPIRRRGALTRPPLPLTRPPLPPPRAGAAPDAQSLPDKTFPQGTTPLALTKKESIKKMLQDSAAACAHAAPAAPPPCAQGARLSRLAFRPPPPQPHPP